jgi:hypothetical protein
MDALKVSAKSKPLSFLSSHCRMSSRNFLAVVSRKGSATMSIMRPNWFFGRIRPSLALSMLLSVLLFMLCLDTAIARDKNSGPKFSPRAKPATERGWHEGINKKLLEEGYICLGLLTIKEKQSKVTKEGLRKTTFQQAAAMGGDLVVIMRDVHDGIDLKTGMNMSWNKAYTAYDTQGYVKHKVGTYTYTPTQKAIDLWVMTVDVWRREPELAAKKLASMSGFYTKQETLRELKKAVSSCDHNRLREILASGIDPSSFRDYSYNVMDLSGDNKSLMTMALTRKDTEAFILLVEAQGQYGWESPIMSKHFFSGGDFFSMIRILIDTDNVPAFKALLASGFNGPYLARQPKSSNLLTSLVGRAAYRDGRIIEELLSMPSWRPVFEKIHPTRSFANNLVEFLYREYVFSKFRKRHERMKARMLRLLLNNGYTVELAWAKKGGATPEMLATMQAAGAK